MTVGGNGGTPVLRADVAGASLANVNNTISGRGQVGNTSLTFINQASGIVNANSSANGLLVNSLGTVNQGLFEATSGGILQVDVAVNNAGGTMTGGAGSSQVQFLTNSNIQGGLLSTASGAGFFGVVSGNGVFLDGSTHGTLTNAAIFTIQNNADAELFGTINNTGSFQVSANGNTTALSMDGAVTLTGAGTVVMTIGGNGGTPVIRQDASSSSLLNVNNTVSGVGQVGNNGVNVTNEAAGVVDATGSALLINAPQFVNQGLLEATTNGTLQIDTLIDNAGGNINANGTGASVQLFTNTRIEGGTLNTLNAPSFFGVVGSNGAFLDGTTQGELTNAAVFSIQNNADAELLGTITNTGSFLVEANGNTTALSAGGPVTLTGGGTVVMTVGGNGGTPVIRADVGGASLTNVNNIFSGRGQVGNATLIFTNQPGGTVNANSSGNGLLVNPASTVNQGLFEATDGGILQIDVTVNNAGGLITAASGSQVQFTNGADIQGGLLTTASGASFFGVMASDGVILDGKTQGSLTNSATFTIQNNADAELFGTINNTESFNVAANGNTTALSCSRSGDTDRRRNGGDDGRWQRRYARASRGCGRCVDGQRE